jgi:hypothetical protein
MIYRVFVLSKSTQVQPNEEIGFPVMAPYPECARMAVKKYITHALKQNPRHYSFVVEEGALAEDEIPLLVTDGQRVNILTADGLGEYVGLA